jgi:hypothetical protein
MPVNTAIRNDQIASALGSAATRALLALRNIPNLVKLLLEQDMWRDRIVEATGERVQYTSFLAFVSDLPPNGLGITLEQLLMLCADAPDVVVLIHQQAEAPSREFLKPGTTPSA